MPLTEEQRHQLQVLKRIDFVEKFKRLTETKWECVPTSERLYYLVDAEVVESLKRFF